MSLLISKKEKRKKKNINKQTQRFHLILDALVNIWSSVFLLLLGFFYDCKTSGRASHRCTSCCCSSVLVLEQTSLLLVATELLELRAKSNTKPPILITGHCFHSNRRLRLHDRWRSTCTGWDMTGETSAPFSMGNYDNDMSLSAAAVQKPSNWSLGKLKKIKKKKNSNIQTRGSEFTWISRYIIETAVCSFWSQRNSCAICSIYLPCHIFI